MASRKDEKDARKQARIEAENQAAAQRKRQKMFAGTGAAALAAVIVVVALVVVSQSGSDDGEVTETEQVAELEGLPQNGTVVGAEAPVKIVEFGDLQCPACKAYSETVIPELLEGPVADGEAQLEFRNFVILGPDSEVAARAALAASEQDRYWEFVELFYRNQGTEGSGYVTDEFLTGIAESAGVADIDAWNSSRENPKWDERLAETQQQAGELGVQSTPSVAIEGKDGLELIGPSPSTADIEDAIRNAS